MTARREPTPTVSLGEQTRSLLRRMPKAELHLHLDGSVRPETALELARDRGVGGPLTLDEVRARLVAPARCRDQAELLRAFELPVALLQDAEALERVAAELVSDVAADGTRYVEIRWAPALHAQRGLALDEGIGAVARGARAGSERTGITVRLVAVAMRSHSPETSVTVAEAAGRHVDSGVTGFDLAGPEAAHPDPVAHRLAFEVARDAGLGITVHAAEWGGAAQVWRALEVQPSRIAHGGAAADDARLMAELVARGVTLDLCPTSNAQANVVPSLAEHPLPRLFRAGVPVTLSTDDRTVSDVTLVDEYERAVGVLGMTPAEVWAIDRHALRAAYLQHDEALRRRLQAEFEAFGSADPGLAPASPDRRTRG